MNKKAVVEGGTILIVAAILIFIVSILGGFKLVSIIKDIPNPVWWGITALTIYLIFKGKN